MNAELNSSGLWKTLTINIIRVLIVDDNPADRHYFGRLLQADTTQAYQVEEASSMEQAIKLLSSTTFDCVLLDFNLPDHDGIGLLKALQESRRNAMTPVIVVTGEGNEDIAVKCLRKGAVDYLSKDNVSVSVFKRAIGNAVAQAGLKRTIDRQTRNLEAANVELTTRNEEIQRFYHTVSHEIKTPLTAIREFVSIVLDGLVGEVNEQQHEILSQARVCCDDIAKQFNDLVDCTRLETGKLKIQLEPCSLPSIFKHGIATTSPAAKEKAITIEHNVDEDLPDFLADTGRIAQVFSNLLGNAIRHTEFGGSIEVFGRRSELVADSIEFGVRDTGSGISPDHLPRIFDRLYQITDDGHEVCSTGLGLGLAISKEIVSLHGGEIRVRSELGVGSTFTVRLPLALDAKEIYKREQTA